jgi:hypothetical protein
LALEGCDCEVLEGVSPWKQISLPNSRFRDRKSSRGKYGFRGRWYFKVARGGIRTPASHPKPPLCLRMGQTWTVTGHHSVREAINYTNSRLH